LATVVDAVSYANFANRCNAPQAVQLAEECVTRSIKLLQATIAHKTLASSNDALCAVYLMGMFGVLLSPQVPTETYLAHSRGAKALLQLRSIDEFFIDRHSGRVCELIVWQLMIIALHHGITPLIPTADIVVMQKYVAAVSGSSSATLLLLVHREAELHARWHETKHSLDPPRSRADLCQFLQTALELDADFQLWESTVPSGWRYQMERNTAHARATYDPKWRDLFLGSRGSPQEIHTYSKLKRCWTWVFYRTTRILVLRDLLEILNWMFKLPPIDEFVNLHPHSPPSQSSKRTSIALDNASLQINHGFATTHLVNMVEKSTAAMFGIFNVSVYGKIDQDLVGMRGYQMTWPLGIIDAVLKLGFVPDSGALATPPHSNAPSPNLPKHSINTTMPSQATFITRDNPQISFHSQGSSIAPQANDSSRILSSAAQNYPSPSSSQISFPPSPKSKLHVFDTSPTHPFDYPTNLSSPEMAITKLARIDVAARREWLNRISYFVATEFGIKTAIAVPASEGFLEVCKKQVEELIAH
ncbi:hypothetical protein DM02DRAFT_61387, partial [Periconia macrospinosa]